MGRFADTLGADTVVARFVAAMLVAGSAEDVGLIVSGLGVVISDRVTEASSSGDPGAADRARDRFPAAMARRIRSAPSEARPASRPRS